MYLKRSDSLEPSLLCAIPPAHTASSTTIIGKQSLDILTGFYWNPSANYNEQMYNVTKWAEVGHL